jgi:histidinol-phosphate aminotransferase
LVLKFDQNTPPLPGVPQVPLAESMARLHSYPDGTYHELREAAASYVGLEPENVVVGAGADDLILSGADAPGPGSCGDRSSDGALHRIATTSAGARSFVRMTRPTSAGSATRTTYGQLG